MTFLSDSNSDSSVLLRTILLGIHIVGASLWSNPTQAQSPGGVATDLSLWLKADAGASTTVEGLAVDQWNNSTVGAAPLGANGLGTYSFDNFNALGGLTSSSSTEESEKPTYLQESINFNPSMSFDGNDHFRIVGLPAVADMSFFVVFKTNTSLNNPNFFSNTTFIGSDTNGFETGSTATDQFSFGIDNGNLYGMFLQGESGEDIGDEVVTDGLPSIATAIRISNDGGNNNRSLYVDGLLDINVSNTGSAGVDLDASYVVDIGQEPTGGGWFRGEIAEIITYSNDLNTTERQQVESYLAAKYGITLDQSSGTDYIASNGSTEMWDKDASDANSYNGNIAIIGRDDGSALSQLKSSSIATDAAVTIANGGNFDAPSPFGNDLSFLSIATDNTDEIDYEVLFDDDSGFLINRTWQVQETGTVGTVTIGLNGDYAGTDTRMVVSSDADFSSSDLVITMTDNGEGYLTASLDLSDGDYFSFVTKAPGGVATGLAVWLKADEGSSTATEGARVDQWDNATTGTPKGSEATGSYAFTGFDALGGQTGPTSIVDTQKPTYLSEGINFNPAMGFSGGEHFRMAGLPATLDMTHFIIFQSSNSTDRNPYYQNTAIYGGDINFSSGTAADVNASEFSIGLRGGSLFAKVTNGDFSYDRGNLSFTDEVPVLASILRDANDAGNNSRKSFLNGLQDIAESDTEGVDLSLESALVMDIGQHPTGGGQFTGKIAEIISFSSALNDTNRQKVESYLALKYGLTLDNTDTNAGIIEGDYVLSDGSIVWEGALSGANAGFHHDVAGVVRDDISGLLQVKSKSENSDAVITIESRQSMSDRQAFVWGNNDGDLTSPNDTDIVFPVEVRLSRAWKVSEPSDVGAITISFDLTKIPGDKLNGNLRLLVDSDGTFSSGASMYAGTITDDVFSADLTGSEIADGDFFTLASINEGNTPLPVTLTHFEGKMMEGQVALTWTTASEQQNESFTLEKSYDAVQWKAFKTLDGAGNSHQIIHYRAYDTQPYRPFTYYRLRQKDVDGSLNYSPIIRVDVQSPERSVIYPNPANETLTIAIPQGLHEVKVSLRDVSGDELFCDTFTASGGEVRFNSSAWKAGIYVMTLLYEHGIERQKIVIEH